MLKRLAAATLMLCAAGGALADDQNWDIGAVPAAPGYYAVVTHAFGSFIDTVSFVVPDGSLGVAANILPVVGASGADGFSGHISNLTYAIWQGDTSLGSYAG